MTSSGKKKWTVVTGRQESVTVEADRMALNETNARVTFYDGEEPVASFVGFSSVYPFTE